MGRNVAIRSKPSYRARRSSPPQAVAVGAEAGAVPGERERRPGEGVLGHGRGGVGVVVLDPDRGDSLAAGALLRVAGGEVVGVEVVDEEARREAEESLQSRHRLLERAEDLEVLEVADVGPERGLVPRRQAEGVLEVRPAGQHRHRDGVREAHRRGHEAAGPAHHERATQDDPGHRVVGPRLDLPVVDEEQVGDAGEAGQRVVVPVGDGLVGEVPRGQDQRAPGRGGEEVVERGVGEEEPHRGAVGGDLRRQARRLPAPHQHHRPLRGGEEVPLGGGEVGEPLRRAQVGHQDRERLLLAPLPLPQACAPRRGRWRRRRGGTRRCPSRRRCAPPRAPDRRPRSGPGSGPARPRGRAARPGGRRPGRPPARRGSGGRRGRGTRGRTPGTCGRGPWWWPPGRRARRGRW